MDHFLFVIAYLFAVKKVAVLSKEIRDGKFQHPVSALKIQPVHTSERDKEDRPLVPPLIAQRLVLADLQPFKQGFAVLLDVKKVGQHVHAQRFAEAPGTGDERDLGLSGVQEIADQTGLIYIIPALASNLCKVRRSDR